MQWICAIAENTDQENWDANELNSAITSDDSAAAGDAGDAQSGRQQE